VAFARFCLRIKGHSGYKGLAIYLKVCSITLMRYSGGQPSRSVAELLGSRVALTSSGIPKIIPRYHRKEIRKGNLQVIRFWLTLFGVYRIIDFKGNPKISTITDPGVNYDVDPFISFIPNFFHKLRARQFIKDSKMEV